MYYKELPLGAVVPEKLSIFCLLSVLRMLCSLWFEYYFTMPIMMVYSLTHHLHTADL